MIHDILPGDFENDYEIIFYKPEGRSEGWSLTPNYGVTIKHKESGLEASCAAYRHRGNNKINAARILITKLGAKEAADKAKNAFPPNHPNFPCSQSPVIEIDIQQVKRDFDNGVLISKATVGQLIDFALSQSTKPLPLIPNPRFNQPVEKHVHVTIGSGGGSISTNIADGISSGKGSGKAGSS